MQKQIRINQLLKLYRQSWPKVIKAKAEQKQGSEAAGAKAAYYANQWLKLKKIAIL